MTARGHLTGWVIILAAAVVAGAFIVTGTRVAPSGPSPRCPCAVPYATASAP